MTGQSAAREDRVTTGVPIALATGAMLASMALGCASHSVKPVEIETGARAEITVDGLHRARKSGYRDAWVKPDTDLSSYDQIMLGPAQISYKRKPKSTRYSSTGSNFALTEKQMEWAKRSFRGAFVNELSQTSAFTLVEAPGPRVLLITPEIIDLVVKVPTHDRVGRDRVYASSTAQMTLLMELRDSLSGEILARVADRREARAAGAGGPSDLYYSTSVSDSAAANRIFRRWARILRARLEAVKEIEPTAELAE